MSSAADTLLKELSEITGSFGEAPVARKVTQTQDGRQLLNPCLTANSPAATTAFAQQASDVDALFADKPAYQLIKREKPEHRLMLWLSLEGHNAKEIASITGYTPEHVRTIRKQPWFREAFCRLSTDAGKDIMTTFLEGYVMDACETLVDLAKNSKVDAVRRSAADAILDRVRGKPTVRVETKTTSTIDATITDVAKLAEESRRLEEQLRSRGAYTPSPS